MDLDPSGTEHSMSTTGGTVEPKDLQTEAQALLARMNDLPPREPGEKLRPTEELQIVEMCRKGETQESIAAAVKCDQSTVSRTIAKYHDTRPLAPEAVGSGGTEHGRAPRH
jgi:hypothetical protein